jgi:hypothetical protein
MAANSRQEFLNLTQESRTLAEKALAKNPGDKSAQYFLASTYGILAAFAITVDHSKVQAFEYGKKSYQLHLQLVSRDPSYYDSYMTLGIYEYIVGNLPWYAKWLAQVAGYHGSVERGFEYLRLAADKGEFAADDARAMLMLFYVRGTQYQQALGIQEYLQKKYPRNYILPLTRGQILEKMGARDLAAAEYQKVIANSEAGIPNFDRIKMATARYTFGQKFLDLERPDLALTQFLAAIQDNRTPERERVLSYLCAGKALDLLGRHTEALNQYRMVLTMSDIEGAHHQAKTFIDRPYRAASTAASSKLGPAR